MDPQDIEWEGVIWIHLTQLTEKVAGALLRPQLF
jgi:hypothetical protein